MMENLVDRLPDLMERLEMIETGDYDVDAARSTINDALASSDDDIPEEIYAALRGWTGRALRSSLSSADLRSWYGLIETVSALMAPDAGWSTRIEVLGELVYERAGMAESRTAEQVSRRRHAPDILRLLAEQPNRALARAEIVDRLGLGQANLTRVCGILADAGLVRRSVEGRNVSFEITATGISCAMRSASMASVIDPVPSFDALVSAWARAASTPAKSSRNKVVVPVSEWEGHEPANDDFEYRYSNVG